MQQREAGQVLGGKYRLVRPLGSGGMGSVWHAEHLTLSSPVALKLIEPATSREPDAVQRFLREARTAAALRSPHVVQILDYGVEGDTPYIAMELLDGESLAERLARAGRLGLHETARVIQHIARAIGRAHDAGIVHRDLKPENVFIVKNDDEEVIKVLDFGIVKTGPGSFGASAGGVATRTGTLIGTPYFMSPEQAEGVKSVDHRTDIWALGVIAFKCLLGHLPFTGDSVGRLILEICSRPLPVPSKLGTVPDGFDAWFARACARDPNERFDSAKKAAAEFTRLESGDFGPPASIEIPSTREARSEPPLGATTGHSTNSEIASRPRVRSSVRRHAVLGLGVAALLGLVVLAIRLRGGESSTEHEAAAAPTAATPAIEPTKETTPSTASGALQVAEQVAHGESTIAAPAPNAPASDDATKPGADAKPRPPKITRDTDVPAANEPKRGTSQLDKPTTAKNRPKPPTKAPPASEPSPKPVVDLGI